MPYPRPMSSIISRWSMNIQKMQPVNMFAISADKLKRSKTPCITILNVMKANSHLNAHIAKKNSYNLLLSSFISPLAITYKRQPISHVPSALIRPLQRQTELSIISENTALMKLKPSGPPPALFPNKINAIVVIRPATVTLPTCITSHQMAASFALLLKNKTK
jgi:hypothetical protein